MRRSAFITAAAITGLASLAACSSSTKTTSAPTTSASSAATASSGTEAAAGSDMIMIKNFMFMPMADTVKVGTKVTWMNMDSTVHSVESSDNAFPTSPDLKQGSTYSFTFTKAGTYSYICGIHQYMMATVTVS